MVTTKPLGSPGSWDRMFVGQERRVFVCWSPLICIHLIVFFDDPVIFSFWYKAYIYIYINIQHEPFETLDWIQFCHLLGPGCRRWQKALNGRVWNFGCAIFFSPWMNQSRSYFSYFFCEVIREIFWLTRVPQSKGGLELVISCTYGHNIGRSQLGRRPRCDDWLVSCEEVSLIQRLCFSLVEVENLDFSSRIHFNGCKMLKKGLQL